jgi:hypothetical protein
LNRTLCRVLGNHSHFLRPTDQKNVVFHL